MDMIALLNKVRSEASDMYKSRIPVATQENLETIKFAMTEGEGNILVANEFMGTIMNKFVKPIVHSKMFKNPLAPLKKGLKPLGDTIEEIYTNFMKADQDAFNGENLLKRRLPDTKTIYHRMNYQSQYTLTVDRTKLSKAFSSWSNLEIYITGIIQAAYNSAELDEYVNMKQVFARAVKANAIKQMTVKNPFKSKENAEEFIETVKTISGLMKYPSTNFNAYNVVQKEDEEALITLSRYDEQVLILPEAVNTKIDVSVLANTFNMTVAEFNKTRKILVDELPVPNCVGALVDEQFLQVHDDLFEVTEYFNAKGLYTNFYLSIRKTISFSVLVNAMLFVYGDDKDNDGEVETFTVTKSIAEGASLSNNQNNVTEGNSYSTTVKGDFASVVVKMGEADITSTAYDSETKKIKVESVTDNLTITVA